MLNFNINYKKIDYDNLENYYLIGDIHFCHKNITNLVNRPSNWKEKIIENWKNTVRDSDTVILVGDVCFSVKNYKPCAEIINNLPGKKILIYGNHDRWMKGRIFRVEYDFILSNLFVKINRSNTSINVFIQHYPPTERDIMSLREKHGRYVHLFIHSHSHDTKPFIYTINGTPVVNVSVEATNYKVVSFRSVIDEVIKKGLVSI